MHSGTETRLYCAAWTMRKMMYGLQPWLEARPAAVGSLDDDYYCITTLPGLNAVPSCVRKKVCTNVDNSPRTNGFRRIGRERPGPRPPGACPARSSDLRAVPPGFLLPG